MKDELTNLNQQDKYWVEPFKEFITELSEPKQEGTIDDVPFLSPIERDEDGDDRFPCDDEQPQDIFNA